MESTLQTAALSPTDPSMPRSKAIAIGFWIVTALFCLQMGFTAYAELRLPQVAEAFTHLGFPAACRHRLPSLRRRPILGHRGLHERRECARVDRLPFVDVDRPSHVAFQAGIEEARWVRDPGPPGERELHDLLIRLPGADNPVVR